ncbi:hypothetical protein NLI96_g12300 [Meripilus lineatus]|uniref:TauD/TfdA-like domain-containing protein n=1 Tax=Meripilus lineatus TaxID=2056292 RepID=A0AAD5UQC2_9APHY|nr:hypothetical protein NLI96_g12300 [Physisporinus lineatus]
MAPVATTPQPTVEETLKKPVNGTSKLVNPFYSPTVPDDGGADDGYEFAHYKPFFPDVKWAPLEEIAVTDRAHSADPEKKALLSAAAKVQHLTPAIGTEISGLDLRQLSDQQKDELALLVAERGVVFLRDQEINIREQLELGRHWGPLHKHATTPIPREPGLEEVHVVYTDGSRRPDPTSFSKLDLWHSDVSYEVQPPSTTSLKVIYGPPYGGDTLWTSGYALYSYFSPPFQKYLETLQVLPITQESHPILTLHRSGFTRRIVGVPKAESDAILRLLFHQLSENPDFQVRFHWEPNSIAIWDNRVTTHSASFDFWPHKRHALRSTPHGEKPISVEEYESGGKVAKDRQIEIWKQQGLEVQPLDTKSTPRGYSD